MSNNVQGYYLFAGVKSDGADSGIYSYYFDVESKNLQLLRCEYQLPGLSYMTASPNGNCVYAAGSENQHGVIYSYYIDNQKGSLKFINQQSVPVCDLSHVHVTHNRILLTSYRAGRVFLYEMLEDGSVGSLLDEVVHTGSGVNIQRQESAHPHSVFVSPNGRFAVVCDLGADRVVIYHLEQDANFLYRKSEWMAYPGMGPRHFAFHPKQKYGYMLTELSSEIVVFSIDERGNLSERQIISALSGDYQDENLSAEIRVSCDGRFLYASNRGSNTITQFTIDDRTGMLSLVGNVNTRGWPREIEISKDGKYLFVLNEEFADSLGMLEGFNVDLDSGNLSSVGFYEPLPWRISSSVIQAIRISLSLYRP
jgi:6-phosphogluconolactonase